MPQVAIKMTQFYTRHRYNECLKQDSRETIKAKGFFYNKDFRPLVP